MSEDTETRELVVALSDDELLEKGKEMSQNLEQLNVIKASAKKSAAEYKAEIEGVLEIVFNLAKQVRDGGIECPVDCTWHKDIEDGKRRLIRNDTHELIEEEDLRPEDFEQDMFEDAPPEEGDQEELPLEEEPNKPPADAPEGQEAEEQGEEYGTDLDGNTVEGKLE